VQPLLFDPLLKRIRWGGRRLGTVLGKPIGAENDYAESWEISDYGEDQSIVSTGPLAGWPLSRLVEQQNLPLLGRATGHKQFPLLIKYLDAHDTLSVQVHPDDEFARQFDPTENGKTEAWVIIDAAPDSRLYVGLKDGVTEQDLRAALESDTVETLLHTINVQAGDCIFVPAGTVHAIGDGILLAEVQQSSDLTFRLYDWGHIGPDGRPRTLHLDDGIQCIDFDRGPVDLVAPRMLPADHTHEELIENKYFVMHRHRSDAPFDIASDELCHVIMVLGGAARLDAGADTLTLPLGQTVLLPAHRDPVTITPQPEVTLLDAIVPGPPPDNHRSL